MDYPTKISHWIGGKEYSSDQATIDKHAPATGNILTKVPSAGAAELARAIAAAQQGFEQWSHIGIVQRADILRRAAALLLEKKAEVAEIIMLECGRPRKDVEGEISAAYECGMFFAGEGRRLYSSTLQSSNEKRSVTLVRDSIGVGALFTPFSTPLSQVAWKTFPALLCGNAVILKAHECAPYLPVWFAKVLQEAGVPDGVYNVLQGTGEGIGTLLSESPAIQFISFTGSSDTGARILEKSAKNLTKVSIEGGGKNPFIVLADADLEKACADGVASAYVDSGQRCAAASRFIVADEVYDAFLRMFITRAAALRIGAGEDDDMGAIISEARLNAILAAVESAKKDGATVALGGARAGAAGYFMQPTVLEEADPKSPISQTETFGPVALFYRVKGIEEAKQLAEDSSLRLSSAIHTRDINAALSFAHEYKSGVVRVNGPTFGSEPHMPFGGPKRSGNGWREPGPTAIDFYSELKQISVDRNS